MTQPAAPALWALRSSTSADESGIVPLWLESFWRSHYARQYACESPKCARCRGTSSSGRDWQCAAKAAYWAEHEPVVHRILARAETTIACDAGEPWVMWGFATTDGPDILHYAMIKRRFRDLGGDVFKALLGDRLSRPQRYTHDLVELRKPDLRVQGVEVPRSWRFCPYLA